MDDIKKAYLLSAIGLGSVATGFVIGAPVMVVTGGICALTTGVAAVVEDKKEIKKKEVLKRCGLYIEVGETIIYPQILKQADNYMLLVLPYGMQFNDVIKRHGFLESYYNKKVLLQQTSNNLVVVRQLNPDIEEDKWLGAFIRLDIIGAVGTPPKLLSTEINNIGPRVTFSLSPGMTIDNFTKKKEQLEYVLRAKVDISIENYNLIIQGITKEFKQSYTIDFRQHIKNDMEFLIGVMRGDTPLTLDLGGNEFSTLVCGASGSGKSVFLNCLMVQFILKDIEIRAIDLKAVEFAIFKRYRNMSKYATSRKDAVEVLADTFDLMQQRYKELEEKNCKSYSDFNKRFDNSMPPVVIVIDEFSALMGDKKSNFFLFELLSRARASNILVVICTQTPRSKVIDGTLRCNIKNTICFSVETDTDSEVALGLKGNFKAARELNNVGRGFLKSKGQLVEFQGYYLSDAELQIQVANKMISKAHKQSEPNKDIPSNVIPLKNENKANLDKVMSAIDNL